MRHKFLVLAVKKWLKSVHIYESYCEIKMGTAFWTTRYDTCTGLLILSYMLTITCVIRQTLLVIIQSFYTAVGDRKASVSIKYCCLEFSCFTVLKSCKTEWHCNHNHNYQW